MDSFHLTLGDRELQNNHILSCINWLRSRDLYKVASLVYIPENAPGSRGSEIAYHLRLEPNSITMSEFGRDMRPGVPKTPAITDNMVLRMRRLLANDAIHMAHDMGTYGGLEATPDKMVDQLIGQMNAVQRVPTHTNSVNTKWSAKGGLSGLDDTVVTALMATYWPEVFYNSPAYDEFRRATNRRIAYV